ncbi:hypothetical protein K0U91_15115 [Chryseobacterium chendengshani]|uniref:hypothetical protein n=1 Tax=Chryseobacterium sp. LJ668 TaxID=2864040 RepID=UPI001C68F955|nr:hypothetical protein [Chryseobacterium sp. LJ668]MBW8522839.1 hypothetical protein [Chryseobacterium sp. LJ668]QYK16371.1 hypothetical protein K0U91_15115 [Chryseobacterium sp. LJ668]
MLNFDAQEKVYGDYKNEFGERLILKTNHTFEYYWNFDLASSWNVGTWEIKNKRYIYLTINEVQDTLKSGNKVEMVLSPDKISNEIDINHYGLSLISGGGQNRSLPPKKLLVKNKKLFTFSKSGKIQNKKIKSVINAKVNSKPWFKK